VIATLLGPSRIVINSSSFVISSWRPTNFGFLASETTQCRKLASVQQTGMTESNNFAYAAAVKDA
jgi:hypothetical protein